MFYLIVKPVIVKLWLISSSYATPGIGKLVLNSTKQQKYPRKAHRMDKAEARSRNMKTSALCAPGTSAAEASGRCCTDRGKLPLRTSMLRSYVLVINLRHMTAAMEADIHGPWQYRSELCK